MDLIAAGGWSPVLESAPLSFDTLRAAWEQAEQPTDENPIQVGDVVIGRHAASLFSMREFKWSDRGYDIDFRVLSRAPKPREPWADLADVLRGSVWERMIGEPADQIAENLHAQGVRVPGGDEA